MKASYRWLRELLPDLKLSPEEVARQFTRGGLEVEGIHAYGSASKSVFVAKVVQIEPHPARAKLRLVTVDLGGRQSKVVCGAPNVPDPGGLVVLAPLGTHLPAKNLTLEPKDIGGVVSEGMLCSEAELGLRISGGDAGILILAPGSATPGQTLADAVPPSSDSIFEIGLTPNRPDGLGHVGLARELAALTEMPFVLVKSQPAKETDEPIAGAIAVQLDDLERCPLYGAALVRNVVVGPSPLAVAYRLESLGVRSISNVVDVTNLMMLEFGHPIHGFDLRFVRKNRIVVRRAAEAEELITLDGVTRKLGADDLVIADGEGAVALAGVMGGQGSELRSDTTDVLIECAYFSPRGVRRSARRQGMHTESSHRFERGVDPGDIDHVLAKTAASLVELAGGTALRERPIFGEPLPPLAPIKLRSARLDALLGLEVPFADAKAILTRLGAEVRSVGEDVAEVVPPSHRPDLRLEEDLIEEVVRVHGIDRVPTEIPAIVPQLHDRRSVTSAAVRLAAIGVGLSEALTFSFVSPAELAAIGAPVAAFTLKNPLTEERSVMRTSLLPGLFEALKRSRRHGVGDVRLFTLGARYLAAENARGLANEVQSFAAVLAGHRDAPLEKPIKLDIYDAKGVAVEIVERAILRSVEVELQPAASRLPHLHPRGAANLVVEGVTVGSFGPVHPSVARARDLGGDAFVIELDLAALERLRSAARRYRPIPTLPASSRDLAIVVSEEIAAAAVASAIKDSAGQLCESVEVFDVFKGGSVPEDHRSLAFHVVYRDPLSATDPARARTLTDVEVDERHTQVVRAVTEKFGARLRS